MGVESHHVIRRRQGKVSEYRVLRGFDAIQLGIVNETTKDLKVDLFGNSNNRKNFTSGDVKILNNTLGYEEDDNSLTMLKNYINSVGYVEVVMFRLQSSNYAQVSQTIGIKQKDLNGNIQDNNIYTKSWYSPNQFHSGIIDVPRKQKIDSDTSFSFNILASTTYVVTMFCGKNKGEVHMRVKSFLDNIQDEVNDFKHYTPITKDKKRILTLIDK